MISKKVLMVSQFLFCFVYVGVVGVDQLPAESLQDTAKIVTILPTEAIQVARPFELRFQVDTRKPVSVELAVSAELSVSTEMPVSTEIADESFKSASSTSLGDFEILSNRSIGPAAISKLNSDADNQFRTTLVLVLEADRAGQRSLPAVNLRITSGEDSFSLTSNPASLNVEGIVPDDFDPTQFRALKPLAEIETPKSNIGVAYWILLPIIFLLIGLTLLIWSRAKTSDAAIRKQWIAEIDLLQMDSTNRSITLAVAHDETCVRLRQWIENSTGIPAKSLPTDSLINELRLRRWPDPLLQRLADLLHRNDQLKFSAKPELSEQASTVFDDARSLIRSQPASDTRESSP